MNFKITQLKNKALGTKAEREKKDKRYPINILVSKTGQGKRYIGTGFNCLESKWDKKALRFKKTVENHQRKNLELQRKLNEVMEFYENLCRLGRDVSPMELKQLFVKGERLEYTLFEYIEKRINDYKQINTKFKYKNLLAHLKNFNEKLDKFEDYNLHQLERFIFHMQNFGIRKPLKSNSVWNVLVRMQSIYNHAEKNGFCPRELNFFSKVEIGKFWKETEKRTMPIEAVEKIKHFDTSDKPDLIHAKNLFLFSYYARGMNLCDMAALKWSDIQDNKIHYRRKKTGGIFQIKVTKTLQDILDFYKAFVITDYVFPIYTGLEKTDKDLYNSLSLFRRYNNPNLKEIGVLVGIESSITMYWARHSVASHLDEKGVPVTAISQILGHSNLKTTQVYLKKLSKERLDDIIDDALE